MNNYIAQELAYKNGFDSGKKHVLESGLYFRLPCRIGDPVYVINASTNSKCVTAFKVLTFYIDDTGLTIACRCDGFTVIRRFRTDDIGVNVFLSREEAEEALNNVSAKSM